MLGLEPGGPLAGTFPGQEPGQPGDPDVGSGGAELVHRQTPITKCGGRGLVEGLSLRLSGQPPFVPRSPFGVGVTEGEGLGAGLGEGQSLDPGLFADLFLGLFFALYPLCPEGVQVPFLDVSCCHHGQSPSLCGR